MKALLVSGYSSLNFSLYQAWVAAALEPRKVSEKAKNQRLAEGWASRVKPSHSMISPV